VSSTLQHQPEESPEENGWRLEDGKYHIVWFEGAETPNILDIVEEDSGGIYSLNLTKFYPMMQVFLCLFFCLISCFSFISILKMI